MLSDPLLAGAAPTRLASAFFITGNFHRRLALGAVYGGATGRGVVPDHTFVLISPRPLRIHCRRLTGQWIPGEQEEGAMRSSRPRTSYPRSAWSSGRRGTARAFYRDRRVRASLLMQEFIGLAYFRRDPSGDLRRAALQPVDRHADAHPAGRHPQSCAHASHGDTKHVLLFPEDLRESFSLGRRGVRPRRPVADPGFCHAGPTSA